MLAIILQALLSLGMLIFGIALYASGRGTFSTYMLIVAGALYLVFEIYQLATYKKRMQKKAAAPEQEQAFIQSNAQPAQNAALAPQTAQAAPQTTPGSGDAAALPKPKNIKLVPAGNTRSGTYKTYLNGNLVGETNARKPLVFSTGVVRNVLSVENAAGEKSFPFFFEVVQDGSGDGTLYIGFDSHQNLIILLSAGMSFSDTMNGIKRLPGD